eukprot:Opistho-2@75620
MSIHTCCAMDGVKTPIEAKVSHGTHLGPFAFYLLSISRFIPNHCLRLIPTSHVVTCVCRAINYKKEDLNKVLKTEYPNGIDVVYESVGGDTFEVCVNRLAPLGRIIVIGFITGYNNDQGFTSVQTGTLLPKLLTKSASVRGFFLFNYANAWKEHTIRLLKLHGEGKIKATIDPRSARGDFVGLDAVAPAVEYLHSGKSFGKVVVNMPSAAKTKSSL